MPKPTYKQTWSPIDVFGLLNGLSTWDDQYRNLKYCRRPYDGVVDMKDRLYRQHENIPSVTKQGLLNGLCNEFLLEPYNVINKKTFELTYEPEVSGTLSGVVDVLCYYKPIDSDTWTQLQPQVWNQDYEYYKDIGSGYIVWQKDRYNNIPNNKNFSYSNLVEVFEDLENETQLKFVYYRTLIDSNNDKQLVLYTDIQNPEDSNDTRYTYLKPEVPNISGDILVYNLDDIPSGIYDTFYNASGQAKQFVYDIKEYLDRKYSHTWGKLQDNSAIWDVEKNYGSGEISHFYDAVTPPKGSGEDCNITGYFTGGIEPCHNTLYMDGLEEVESGQRQLWLPKLYPGKFYVNGYSYYFFENPQIENISFANGTGLLPSGIENYHHTILATSGYYNNSIFYNDSVLSGKVYEDYSYPTGSGNQLSWNSIYRRVPHVDSTFGPDFTLNSGQYYLDFTSGLVISYDSTSKTIIWDDIDVPSGSIINYDINPLNNENVSFSKYFMYIGF